MSILKKMEMTVILDKGDEKIDTKGKYLFSNEVKSMMSFFEGYLYLLKNHLKRDMDFILIL